MKKLIEKYFKRGSENENDEKYNISLEELKILARHESVSTTEGYLRNKDTDILEGMFGIKLK